MNDNWKDGLSDNFFVAVLQVILFVVLVGIGIGFFVS